MLDSSSSVAAIMGNSISDATGASSGVTAAAIGGKGMNVDKVSTDFESMFLSEMMQSMFGDSSGDDAFGSSQTNDIYKGMMMDQYGKAITQSGGIGIASYVKQELLKLQETAS